MPAKFSTNFLDRECNKLFLIAEIGINHNGCLSNAFKLIESAAHAGFDAVKFQKRDIESCYSQEFLASFRDSPWGKTQKDQKEALEFSREEYIQISKFCEDLNILWTASPWDINSVEFLDSFNLPFVKIPSAKTMDREFVKSVSSRPWFIFVSTGMCTLEEIDQAVEILSQNDASFQLMHCVSTYPMDDSDANLRVIPLLQSRYGSTVGYSGHEKTLLKVCISAAALGAKSFERHITLDRTMYGSDQAASIEVGSLRQFVSTLRLIPEILGSGKKKITTNEAIIRSKLARKP